MSLPRAGALCVLLLSLAASAARGEACPETARLAWGIDGAGRLWSVHPELLVATRSAALSCPRNVRPVALTARGDGSLLLGAEGGALFVVDPATGACRPTGAKADGLVTLTGSDEETLRALLRRPDGAEVFGRLDAKTGVLSDERPLGGGALVAGPELALSPGRVPQIWLPGSEGPFQRRVALNALRGAPDAKAFVRVDGEPWVLLHDSEQQTSKLVAIDVDAGRVREVPVPGLPPLVLFSASPCARRAFPERACSAAVRIESPVSGALWSSWRSLELSGAAEAASPIHLRVDGPGISRLVKVDVRDGRFATRLSIDVGDRQLPLTIRPSDEDGHPCGEAVKVIRSKLALRDDVQASCERACGAEVTLSAEPGDTLASQFVDSSRLRVVARAAGVSAQVAAKDGVHVLSFDTLPPGLHRLVVRWEALGLAMESEHALRVPEEASLALPERFELGPVASGTDWKETCRTLPLDLRGASSAKVKVVAHEPRGCRSRLLTSVDGKPVRLGDGGVELEIHPGTRLPLCLESAPCDAPESVGKVRLEVTPQTPGVPPNTTTIAWEVSGTDPMQCRGPLFAWGAGGVLLLLVLLGFVTPTRFPPTLVVKAATRRELLEAAQERALRALPGGRRGWYRAAGAGLDAEGLPARGDDAVASFESSREQVFVSGATLRRFNPQTHRLDPVEGGREPLREGAIYEASGVWFTAS